MRPAPINCNGAVLLAALSPDDLDTSARLEGHFRNIASAHSDLGRMHIERHQIRSRAGLFLVLADLQRKCGNGLRPILHLDMHGSPDGLTIPAEDGVIGWEDLRAALTGINRATRCQLCLTLAVCSGAYIIKLIEPTDPAPFWSIVGAAGIVYNLPAYEFFREYYEALFRFRSSARAFEHARQESPSAAQHFEEISAREIFVRTVSGIVAGARTAKGKADMVEKARLRAPGHRYDLGFTSRVREKFNETWMQSYFSTLRARFFMADADPDVLDRCGVEWGDILEEADRIGRGESL